VERVVAAVLASASLAGCAFPNEATDVSYDDRYGDDTTLDVYWPDEDTRTHPLVLMIHGGAWVIGDKFSYTLGARRLAGSGYVAASINYRLVPDGVYPAAVRDCFCALSYLRAHAAEYRIDVTRVAVTGVSSGGHLAALVGLAAKEPDFEPDCASGPTEPADAVAAISGIMDLRLMANEGLVQDFIGGTLDEYPERFDRASPVEYASAQSPPFLLVHGDDDAIVDAEQSEVMRDALVAAGADARLLVLPGGGHILNGSAGVGSISVGEAHDDAATWPALIDFLYETLGEP
jgi:acetyl esterase/lipase